jgi:hypothetical protein
MRRWALQRARCVDANKTSVRPPQEPKKRDGMGRIENHRCSDAPSHRCPYAACDQIALTSHPLGAPARAARTRTAGAAGTTGTTAPVTGVAWTAIGRAAAGAAGHATLAACATAAASRAARVVIGSAAGGGTAANPRTAATAAARAGVRWTAAAPAARLRHGGAGDRQRRYGNRQSERKASALCEKIPACCLHFEFLHYTPPCWVKCGDPRPAESDLEISPRFSTTDDHGIQQGP